MPWPAKPGSTSEHVFGATQVLGATAERDVEHGSAARQALVQRRRRIETGFRVEIRVPPKPLRRA